jgi:transcriptional regulator with XRE-family HTH domain
MKQIGGTLRAFRLQRKLSLRDVEKQSHVFAEETGHDSYRISASWLDRLERAEHKLTTSKLVLLAHTYGVHPDELFRAMYPDSLGRDPPPDATTLLSPGPGPSRGPYRWGLVGRRDLTLAPLIRAGSVVQIDTRRPARGTVDPGASSAFTGFQPELEVPGRGRNYRPRCRSQYPIYSQRLNCRHSLGT